MGTSPILPRTFRLQRLLHGVVMDRHPADGEVALCRYGKALAGKERSAGFAHLDMEAGQPAPARERLQPVVEFGCHARSGRLGRAVEKLDVTVEFKIGERERPV